MIRFEVNETAQGIVAPPKEVCKVVGCERKRFKARKGHVFCKQHSGFKPQIPRAKFKDLIGNNELVIAPLEKAKRKSGFTSKRNKMRAFRREVLGIS